MILYEKEWKWKGNKENWNFKKACRNDAFYP